MLPDDICTAVRIVQPTCRSPYGHCPTKDTNAVQTIVRDAVLYDCGDWAAQASRNHHRGDPVVSYRFPSRVRVAAGGKQGDCS